MEESCVHTIEKKVHDFCYEHERYPNRLILGVDIVSRMMPTVALVVDTMNPDRFFYHGIEAEVDYTHKDRISVGLVSD